MKIHCHSQELLEAVSLVASVVASNATRPILQSVYLKADGDGLLVQGTDLEVGLSVRCDEVVVDRPGALAMQASRFHAILREIKDDQIVLDLNEDGSLLRIHSGGSDFKVPCEAEDEFPVLNFSPPSSSMRVQREEFLAMLRRVSVAAAKDATRYQMHSVLLDSREHSLRLVSTDGKRLAFAEIPIPADHKSGVQDSQYIVPLKGVDLLIKILSSEESEVIALHLDQSEVTYSSDRVSLSCRLVEGRFPDYERALPNPGNYIYEIPAQALTVALRQAALMTTKETNSVQFDFDGTHLVISTAAASLGESRVELEVSVIEAPEAKFSINFNPAYLIDLLKVLGSANLKCVFKNRTTAGSFTLDGLEDRYRHIVMPLVTQE